MKKEKKKELNTKKKKKKSSHKMRYKTVADKILVIIMLFLIAGFCGVITFCVYIIKTAPSISEERLYQQNVSILYDKFGNEFARLGYEKREKVTYDQLPEVLIDAIVATEDSRFFQHNGIDIARFTKAVIGQLLGQGDAGGGSTLTMQVSKNATGNMASHGLAGIIRKFTDIYLAVFVLEKRYTKEEILEFYVNIPNLGASSYGVEQASLNYFGKSVSELNLAEAALIAGLFQAPSAYDPYYNPEAATIRRDTVLNLMVRHGYITEEEKEIVKKVPVESLLVKDQQNDNAHISFINTLRTEIYNRTGNDVYNVAMNVYTTYDPNKQATLNDIMSGKTYKWQNDYVQAGIAVIDVKDGSLVAVADNRGSIKGNEQWTNFATSVRRHPGSVAKPIIDYGPAIEYLGWSTGTTIIDDELTYSDGGEFKNHDNKYDGVTTVKKALARSRNIPALYTFQQTTAAQKHTFTDPLNWETDPASGDVIYESCAIGGNDNATPLIVAAAYATFARGGTYIEPYSFTKIEYIDSGDEFTVTPKKTKVMSEETAYIITMILKYAVTSGSVTVGSVSGTDIAGKTGTSTIDKATLDKLGLKGTVNGNSWLATYSPDYAIAMWYGYEPMVSKEHYLGGNETVSERNKLGKLLTKGIFEKNSKFKQPSGIVTAEIELETDPLELASPYTPSNLRSTEYFKKGTVPSTTSTRFSQLSDPSNLNYTLNGNEITLTWDMAPLPDAVNQEFLTNYFTNSQLYSRWAEKYLNKRLEYNNKNIGQFGYQVFVTDSTGTTTNIGFTTENTFKANLNITNGLRITVKSSYSIFKANQSNGISVDVVTGIPNTPETPEG